MTKKTYMRGMINASHVRAGRSTLFNNTNPKPGISQAGLTATQIFRSGDTGRNKEKTDAFS
jgi:hypothetical protein